MKRNVFLFLLAFVVGTFAMAQTTELKKGYGQQRVSSTDETGINQSDDSKFEKGYGQQDDVTLGLAAVPANDLCANAETIALYSTTSGTTTEATFDDVDYCGTSNTAPGVWYTFEAVSTNSVLYTCDQASYDTKISVFSGSCAALVCEGGNDDGTGCFGFTSYLDLPTTIGETYYVLVHGFGTSSGNFDLTLDAPLPVPGNDLCEDAITIACGELTSGYTINATFDDVGVCGTSNTAPGVWYTFIAGTTEYTASLCNFANFDTKISVFSGEDCNNLICVDGNDDACGLQSELTFTTEQFETYYILVHGFGSAEGEFDLTLTATPCVTAQVPVSNWAIVLGVLLIGTFIVVRYKRKLA